MSCEALGRALARHEWTPTERAVEQAPGLPVILDHDEPEVSDLFAERRRPARTGPGCDGVGGARPPADLR